MKHAHHGGISVPPDEVERVVGTAVTDFAIPIWVYTTTGSPTKRVTVAEEGT